MRPNWTPEQRIAFLQKLKTRAKLHTEFTAAALVANLDKMIENAGKEDRQKEYLEKVRLAREGDIGLQAEVAKIRSIRLNNFIIARSNAMTFFDIINLADNEIPYVENTTRFHVIVSYIGQDGRPRKMQIPKEQVQAQIPLKFLSSEEVEYPLIDIYRGHVADDTKALVDIGFDMDVKVDQVVFPLVTGAIGAFTLTGAKASRVYVPHGGINVANLPTTNDVPVVGAGAGTKFNKAALDAILQYVAAWGNVFPGETMKPVTVYIPSKDAMGFLDSITITSQPNSLVEAIIDTGFPFHYVIDWTIVADPTLDPDAGYAYVKTNRPVGTVFTKTSLDKTFDQSTPEMERQNKGMMWQRKVIGGFVPAAQKMNVLRVRYKTGP